MKQLAQGISYILHPLLWPLYGVFFIFNTDSVFSLIPFRVKAWCYGITFLCLCVLPLITLPLFKKFRLIRSYALESRQDRIYPVFASVVYTFLGFYVLRRIPFTNIVQQLYLVVIIVLAGFAIVNFRWKMSMHMTVIGAVCGFLLILGFRYFGNIYQLFILMLLLSGMLGSCRLYLKRHTPAQVYTGFLFGLGLVLLILF